VLGQLGHGVGVVGARERLVGHGLVEDAAQRAPAVLELEGVELFGRRVRLDPVVVVGEGFWGGVGGLVLVGVGLDGGY
jgi:hypothetical protein